jgi:PTH1 family peptidyl-tRNA hydrolase
MVLEKIAGDHGIRLSEKRLYMAGKGSIEGVQVALVEPLTFMNLSGTAVREAVRRFGPSPETLLVIHDDLDMETGRLKIKTGGGPGGHKGISSIIQNIGSKDFVRVKIGIGRGEDAAAEKYVLSKFKRSELPALRKAVQDAADAVKAILSEGVQEAMNRYNRKPGAD